MRNAGARAVGMWRFITKCDAMTLHSLVAWQNIAPRGTSRIAICTAWPNVAVGWRIDGWLTGVRGCLMAT
eukprot:8691536-Lingulodinium_polyedra.AAC.1